jgi:hypothetical protein
MSKTPNETTFEAAMSCGAHADSVRVANQAHLEK